MILGYVPGRGVLHRAHPFTVLALAGAAVALALALPSPQGSMGVALALCLLALVARVARALVTAAALTAPFWVFLVLIHVVFGDDPGRAVAVGGLVSAIVVVSLLVLATVHPARLIDALLDRGFPFSIAYLLAATLQSVPRLTQRAVAILEAQRCRGLRVRGSLWRRANAVVPLAIPLVLGALAEVEERGIALEARGAAAPTRRTPLSPPRDSGEERVLRWALVFSTVTVILVRVLW